ncbi:MAG: patatin-like phospholipase family protein [Ideonella sp.]|nr:patatin-like phospholipase family protein [Ideonella sp.]
MRLLDALRGRRSSDPSPQPPTRRPLLLALQGGGAHGAFTWGVLDALLEREDLAPVAASGASAGALNAALLASGLAAGGAPAWQPGVVPSFDARAREQARETLAAFWLGMAEASPFEKHAAWLLRGPADNPSLSPLAHGLMQWAALFTPEQLDPLDLNPLRDLIARHVDAERLRAASPLRLFVSATHIATSSMHLFTERQMSVEALLASTCLPRWHRTVEIGGEAYWDGGFSANPPLGPLVFDVPDLPGHEQRDVLMVLLSPLVRPALPTGTREIALRQLELAFAAPLVREWQWIEHARREADRSGLPAWRRSDFERRVMALRWHTIDTGDLPAAERADSKVITTRAFVESLREAGRAAAQAWMSAEAPLPAPLAAPLGPTVSAPRPSSAPPPPRPPAAP